MSPTLPDPEGPILTHSPLRDLISARLHFRLRWIWIGALLSLGLYVAGYRWIEPTRSEVMIENLCLTADRHKRQSDLDPSQAHLCALSPSDWRGLSENLGALGGSLSADPQEDLPVPLSDLMDARWWERHVIPVYGLNPSDLRNFPSLEASLKKESSPLRNLKITLTDASAIKAQDASEWVLRLIREGGQRLALRRLLDTYGADVALSTSQMAQKRLALNLEVRQLEDRIRHLRTLQNQAERLPPTETLALVTGIGESTYLPLATQADAGEIELQGLREKIHRLDDQVLSDRVTSIFLERAAPKVRTLSQGLKSPLMPRLLPLIDALDREMAPTDRVAHARIARIRADLIEIHARYITQLPVLSKTLTPSRIRPLGLALSLLAGAVLGLLVALIRQTLRRIASTASH